MSRLPSSRRKLTLKVAHERSMADERNFGCGSAKSRNWALSSQ